MTVFILSYRDKPPDDGSLIVNTTSRSSDTLTRQLSPFFLGPCALYDGYVSQNVENGWQFSKLYPQHADAEGNPTEAYWEWAKAGWTDTHAQRYPMGKGAKPLYSLWEGERLQYVEARKRIYIPLYATQVVQTRAYRMLCDVRDAGDRDIYLVDFDGYNHRKFGMTHTDALNSENRKMGHAFVIAMLLDGYLDPSTGRPYQEEPPKQPLVDPLELAYGLPQE